MRDHIIVVHKPEYLGAETFEDSITERAIANTRAADGIERRVTVIKPAEGQSGQRRSQAVAGKTYFCIGMLLAVFSKRFLHLWPHLVQSILESEMYSARIENGVPGP